MYKVYMGANGYYVAWEQEDGYHHQPQDNGSQLGWDRLAAARERERRSREESE
jgi:hypothetical protein